MRTLKRPMFNMGGPIKEGIMHKIREPYKNGTRAALVGNPIFPKDKSGRAHHVAWFAALPWLARAAPAVIRGYRGARMFTPWKENLGKWGRFKDIVLPSGRFKNVPGKKGTDPSSAYIKGDFTASAGTPGTAPSKLGFWKAITESPKRFGAAVGENPITSLGLASLVPQTGYAGYKVAKATPGALWSGAKRYADLVIPGDQSSWWKDEPPTDVPLNPNLEMNIKKKKKGGVDTTLTEQQRKNFAAKQRDERVQKYLDMMGYDRSKKTAVADALIDASKIVSDRGTLDKKNITAELINPIIQATSKRFDKPDQIREAVGLMAAKAEIQKDLEKETKALDREYKQSQIDIANLKKGVSFEQEMGEIIAASKDGIGKKQLERLARQRADKYGEEFTVVEDASVIANKPGIYMLEDKIFRVYKDGKSKQII